MRLFILVSLALVLGVGLLVACNSNETLLAQTNSSASSSPQANVTNPADGARRIKVDELHALWEKNNVLIIDTRAEAAYKESHIKGSISMPTGTILQHLDELPRNKMIVAYCTWPSEHTSAGAVIELNNKGITNAAALLGGLAAWKDAGYPVEGTSEKK
jgi:rhodanese-related sulfurtransferase